MGACRLGQPGRLPQRGTNAGKLYSGARTSVLASFENHFGVYMCQNDLNM